MDLLLHPEEPGGLLLLKPGERNPGPAGDDEADLFLADHRAPALSIPLPLFLLEPDLILEIPLRIPECRGAFEVLVAD
ncbi:MAG: hypothetical protein ABW208_26120, partial [Pyrinomonadaceae bacterium]